MDINLQILLKLPRAHTTTRSCLISLLIVVVVVVVAVVGVEYLVYGVNWDGVMALFGLMRVCKINILHSLLTSIHIGIVTSPNRLYLIIVENIIIKQLHQR